MLFQSLQTLLKVQNGLLMKEKELIERIQNYTFKYARRKYRKNKINNRKCIVC